MKLLLDKYEKYLPEYDSNTKELALRGKIPVKEFVELRLLIKMYRLEVNEIKVNW